LEVNPKPLPTAPQPPTVASQQVNAAVQTGTQALVDIKTTTKIIAATPALPDTVPSLLLRIDGDADKATADFLRILSSNTQISERIDQLVDHISKLEGIISTDRKNSADQLAEVKTTMTESIQQANKRADNAEAREKATKEASNNKTITLCWTIAAIGIILGIVIIIQFPAFWKIGSVLASLGGAALLTAIVMRQVLLWSQNITFLFIVLLVIAVNGAIWWVALGHKHSSDEQTEGINALKKLIPEASQKDADEKLDLVSSPITKDIVTITKKALKLGKFA